MPDNKVIKLLVEGIYKASLTDITEKNGALVAKIKKLPTYSRIALEDSESEALLRSVKDVFEQYSSFFPRMPKEIIGNIMCQSSPVKLFEAIVFNSSLSY